MTRTHGSLSVTKLGHNIAQNYVEMDNYTLQQYTYIVEIGYTNILVLC